MSFYVRKLALEPASSYIQVLALRRCHNVGSCPGGESLVTAGGEGGAQALITSFRGNDVAHGRETDVGEREPPGRSPKV